jgi:hypothetical protein
MCWFRFVPCRPWVALVAVCILAPLSVRAEDPDHDKVTIKIRPVVLFAGGEVKTTVRTPRDARNRALRIVVEGPDYFASSDVQLDGVDAAINHQFTWKDLPGGPYRVDAILLRENDEKSTVTNCFAVISGDENEPGTDAVQPTRRRQQRVARPPESMGIKSGC